MALPSNNVNDIETLTLFMAVVGAAVFFVQLIIWTQINNRLPPKEQVGWQQTLLKDLTWFQEGGLLAQHARLYPESRLGTVFKVLWGTFWVLVATRILAK